MTRLTDVDMCIAKIKNLSIEYDAETVQRCIEVLSNAPTIEAEPVRHGKWITEECLPGVAVCSICGHEIRGIGCQYTKYCDECGARMDKE